MKQHFITFYSPGTLIAEQTTKPIPSWDIEQAITLAATITERYGAKPYGFQFSTRSRTESELDSSEVARSPMHYMNCHVESLEEIKARQDPNDRILISNMQCNGWNRVVRTKEGWRWTQPLLDKDVVIP